VTWTGARTRDRRTRSRRGSSGWPGRPEGRGVDRGPGGDRLPPGVQRGVQGGEAGVRDLVRRTSIIMDGPRNELPRLRAELREVQERVRERLR
jgi:hypothetical protein